MLKMSDTSMTTCASIFAEDSYARRSKSSFSGQGRKREENAEEWRWAWNHWLFIGYNSNGNIPKTVAIMDTMDITTLMDIIMIVIGDHMR